MSDKSGQDHPTDAAIKGLADFIKFNRTINDFAFNFEIDNFCTIAQHQQLWDALRHNTKITNLWLDHSSYDDKCFPLTVRNTKIEHIVTSFMEEYGVTQEISDLYVKNYSNLFLGRVDFQWSAQIIEEELKEGEISLSEIDSDVNGALLNIARNDADAFQLYVLQAQWLEIKIDLIFQYGTEEEISEFISQCLNLTPKVQVELSSIFYEKLMMHVFALQRYELCLELYVKFKPCQVNVSLFNYAIKIYLTGDDTLASNIDELHSNLPKKNVINALSKDKKDAFLNKIIVLKNLITAGQRHEANQTNTSLSQIKNYTDSFDEALEEYHSLKYLEKIFSSKRFENTNSTGIKAIQAILDSDLSFKEKIHQIKTIAIEKIKPGFSYWYSHSHFFGKGRDKLVEDIYIHLSALPISLQNNVKDKPSDLLQAIAEFTP
ncbi:MAG: hypothetical protein J0I93_14965 [Legionella sp.]|nr:hypothetical protein [Legionella sp.]